MDQRGYALVGFRDIVAFERPIIFRYGFAAF